MDLYCSTMKPVQMVMEDADLQKKDVDEIVLVGGSTHIPMVQKLVNSDLIQLKLYMWVHWALLVKLVINSVSFYFVSFHFRHYGN